MLNLEETSQNLCTLFLTNILYFTIMISFYSKNEFASQSERVQIYKLYFKKQKLLHPLQKCVFLVVDELFGNKILPWVFISPRRVFRSKIPFADTRSNSR